jgi:hypothetical protein
MMLAAAILAGGALIGSGAAASAGHASGTLKVSCANNSLSQVSFKKTPRHCIFVEPGGTASYQSAPTKSMKWEHWGHPHARGKGMGVVNMLGDTPIKVVLSKPVTNCNGQRVYSKAKIKYPELGTGGDSRLEICRR